jgi:hypothetical protein
VRTAGPGGSSLGVREAGQSCVLGIHILLAFRKRQGP